MLALYTISFRKLFPERHNGIESVGVIGAPVASARAGGLAGVPSHLLGQFPVTWSRVCWYRGKLVRK